MENVTDALIMAGQVLIFIVALTVCMSSFTTLREHISDITRQRETVQMAKNSEGYINYIESKNDKSVRIVGAETVVSSMYRAIKENYEIYIKLNDLSGVESTGVVFWEAKESNTRLGITAGTKLIKITIGRKSAGINQDVNSILSNGSNGFYEKIKSKKFKEYIGEYKNDGKDIALENKTTKRIITYIEV